VFELFAAPNAGAQQAGFWIGVLIAAAISASIPIAFGSSKGQPILGAIGGVCAGGAAFLFGCLGGLPVAAVFCIIIFAVSSGGSSKRRRRPRYDPDEDEWDDEEDYERRRR
jgi:hypothetical protein